MTTTTTLQQQISEADKAFADAYNSGNLDNLATNYEDGFWMVPPGAPAVRAGSRDVAEAFKEMYQAGIRNMTSDSIEFASDGDLAYHLGRSRAELVVDGSTQEQVWTFLDVYRRDAEGNWKVHISIWNDDELA